LKVISTEVSASLQFADRVRGEFCERRISRNNIELLNGTIFADKKVKDEDALVIEQPA